MNFTVSSTALLSRLQAVGRVILSKNSLSILDNFLLKIEGNTLTITASDLETTLVTSLEVQSSADICLAINAKLLTESLKEFSEQPLQFEIDDENLSVLLKTDNGNYNFIGARGNEFPQLPAIGDEAQSFSMPVNVLTNGVSRALFATATDDLRPTMTGILFDIKPENITFVATDAHKLVRCINTQIKSEIEATFILPKKPATLIKSIVGKDESDVEVRFDKKNIIFELPLYTIVCRQIEGRYPNYNGVIPQNSPFKLTVDRLTLINAARRVHAFSNQGTELVKLAINADNIVLTAQDVDLSTSGEETIPCQYEGDPLEIGFKEPFLVEILNNINSADIVLHLIDQSRAVTIEPTENEKDEELLMLLMPMLLNQI